MAVARRSDRIAHPSRGMLCAWQDGILSPNFWVLFAIGCSQADTRVSLLRGSAGTGCHEDDGWKGVGQFLPSCCIVYITGAAHTTRV